MMKTKLIVATKNKGKIAEIRNILPQYDILSMEEINIDIDVVEDGNSFAENAMKKAREIMAVTKTAVIADDSGLVVEALNGAPGIYSARYSGEGATDMSNNLKLLDEMKDVKNRNAKFVCNIAYVTPNGDEKIFEGEFYGKIYNKMVGENGFGYDVLFYVEEYGKTSAELSPELKNKISHRGKALKKLKNYLEE